MIALPVGYPIAHPIRTPIGFVSGQGESSRPGPTRPVPKEQQHGTALGPRGFDSSGGWMA